jgi:hypothetical protein
VRVRRPADEPVGNPRFGVRGDMMVLSAISVLAVTALSGAIVAGVSVLIAIAVPAVAVIGLVNAGRLITQLRDALED